LADQYRELLAIDDVLLGAELAAYFGASFGAHHVLDFGRPEKEQRAEHALASARTTELDRLVCDRSEVEALQDRFEDLPWAFAAPD
jgi:hypothetical protein